MITKVDFLTNSLKKNTDFGLAFLIELHKFDEQAKIKDLRQKNGLYRYRLLA
jgi:hypothetical protein